MSISNRDTVIRAQTRNYDHQSVNIGSAVLCRMPDIAKTQRNCPSCRYRIIATKLQNFAAIFGICACRGAATSGLFYRDKYLPLTRTRSLKLEKVMRTIGSGYWGLSFHTGLMTGLTAYLTRTYLIVNMPNSFLIRIAQGGDRGPPGDT